MAIGTITVKVGDLPELMDAINQAQAAIDHLRAERDQLRTKLEAVREVAAEAVNKWETPEVRLAMIVRLCDFGRESS